MSQHRTFGVFRESDRNAGYAVYAAIECLDGTAAGMNASPVAVYRQKAAAEKYARRLTAAARFARFGYDNPAEV